MEHENRRAEYFTEDVARGTRLRPHLETLTDTRDAPCVLNVLDRVAAVTGRLLGEDRDRVSEKGSRPPMDEECKSPDEAIDRPGKAVAAPNTGRTVDSLRTEEHGDKTGVAPSSR